MQLTPNHALVKNGRGRGCWQAGALLRCLLLLLLLLLLLPHLLQFLQHLLRCSHSARRTLGLSRQLLLLLGRRIDQHRLRLYLIVAVFVLLPWLLEPVRTVRNPRDTGTQREQLWRALRRLTHHHDVVLQAV